MNPSEANVFSSGISGFLSSKNRKDVSYSRLNQMDDDSVEFSKVHFQKDHPSLCAKICFSLLALILLFATVATAVLIMNLKNFTVKVQLEKGKVRVYRFDQEMITITGNEVTSRNMSFVVSMHVINKTESECWFGIVLSFPKDATNILPVYSKDFAFLTRVTSAELGDFQDGPQNHFKVFGNRNTNHELSFYVHNILHQLLPIIKVKLYEFVLSKVSSSSRKSVVEKHGFLPGRVHVKRTMITNRDIVTVTAQSKPQDFENFISGENRKSTERATWKLTYDETTVVNKQTGMVKRSDMSLSCDLPLSDGFTPARGSNPQGLAVKFRSVVKLLDKSEVKVKAWKNVLGEEKDTNHPLNPPNAKDSSLLYFAPPKHNFNKGLPEELKELIKLGKNSAGRSTKLPPMIKIVHHNIPKSAVNADESDEDINDDDDDDYRPFDENNDDDDENNDDSDNDDDNNAPYWPQPNFAPFGIGFEVKRKRSVEARKPHLKKQKTAKNSQPKRKTPGLNVIWDEITSSTPMPLHEAPRLVQTSILGLDFRAEIDYQVTTNDEDYNDNDDDEDWSIITGYRVTLGQYRIAPFKRVHTLNKIRDKLPGKGQRKISRWTVNAGDFVMCTPLFYIQRLCTAIRLTFDVTVTYSLPRLSLSYPVQLTVRIGQTVTTNATLSGHVSTWFHKSGLYTKGTVAMSTLPVSMSFKEDTAPEWCIKGNLEQKMVRMNTVPLSSWNCSLHYTTLSNTCKGLPASNATLMTFDLRYSSTEGTMFDNWHYPISCKHQKDFSSY
ncbi:hypothetical protein ACROYT_G030404 [Oculina patagonica]